MVRDFLLPGFAACNYDPFDEITTVVTGISLTTELGVFVVRGLDRDKTLGCLRSTMWIVILPPSRVDA